MIFLELRRDSRVRRGIQDASCVGPGNYNVPLELRKKAGDCSRVTAGPIDLIEACVQKPSFLSRGDRDLGVAFQTHPGRQAFISSGSKEPALLSSRDGYLLELTVWTQGSQASRGVWREVARLVSRPRRRRRPSSLDDGGISGLFSSGGPSVRFLTRYDGEVIEPLVGRQGSQVCMRVARGSASLLPSHGRGLWPRDVLKKVSRIKEKHSSLFSQMLLSPRDYWIKPIQNKLSKQIKIKAIGQR